MGKRIIFLTGMRGSGDVAVDVAVDVALLSETTGDVVKGCWDSDITKQQNTLQQSRHPEGERGEWVGVQGERESWQLGATARCRVLMIRDHEGGWCADRNNSTSLPQCWGFFPFWWCCDRYSRTRTARA